ncbi:MAG: type II toxin-antitoxin system VapC family toxin [Bryobacteraceae bacterium]|jgi:PIN domain nuclease of toxin-antitoxin system
MYLLDTHTLVWGITAPEELPQRVRDILTAGEVIASVVSYWELILKKGRPTALVLDPKDWWTRYITRLAVEVLPVRVTHVDQLDALAEWHRDPFDRMLIAQALAEGHTLVSRDGAFGQYGVRVVWA